MSTDLSSTPSQSSSPHFQEEARLTLRQVVQSTLADLAEMDRLLDRAEQLVSCGSGRNLSLFSHSDQPGSD